MARQSQLTGRKRRNAQYREESSAGSGLTFPTKRRGVAGREKAPHHVQLLIVAACVGH